MKTVSSYRLTRTQVIFVATILIITSLMIYFGWSSSGKVSYISSIEYVTEPTIIEGPKVTHIPMPDEVRAIYMTACWGGDKKLRDSLVKYVEDTKLNSVIIDIKDYTGTISVPVESDTLKVGTSGKGCKIPDIREFIEELHDKGIYVIGRITVFQDPLYAKIYPELAVQDRSAWIKGSRATPWKDYKGLAFIDVGARQYWDYVITLAKEAHDKLGFDEINFDYIRYPSDGNMSNTYYPHSGGERYDVDRADELEKFFAYLHEKMREPNVYGEAPKISADIFGMTTTNYDDLTIGQILEKVLPYFDVVAPMVYPSHYPKGFMGFDNVNNYPYEIVYFSMKSALDRAMATTTKIKSLAYERIGTSTPPVYEKPVYGPERLRAWIQDFDYGGDYDVPEINAQIRASRDAGITGGYMIWSPGNRYTRGIDY